MDIISIDDFKKVQIKVGEILSAEKIPDTDKLLKLIVAFGEEKRQIVSGISAYYPDPNTLVGVKCAFVYNLEPRVIRGHESQGMIMAAVDEATGIFSLLQAQSDLPSGSSVR